MSIMNRINKDVKATKKTKKTESRKVETVMEENKPNKFEVIKDMKDTKAKLYKIYELNGGGKEGRFIPRDAMEFLTDDDWEHIDNNKVTVKYSMVEREDSYRNRLRASYVRMIETEKTIKTTRVEVYEVPVDNNFRSKFRGKKRTKFNVDDFEPSYSEETEEVIENETETYIYF